MKKQLLRFSCNLGEAKDYLFTVQGSPFYFIPKKSDTLTMLKKWQRGTALKITGYKMSERSQFIRVISVKVDSYQPFALANMDYKQDIHDMHIKDITTI